MKATTRLLNLVDQLIAEGNALMKTEWTQRFFAGLPVANPESFVDLQGFYKWSGGCRNLIEIIGARAATWKAAFDKNGNTSIHAKQMLGLLQAIRDAIAGDLLISVEDLVFAEAFDDLLEQAEYLLKEGYFIAAGVLGRAVLEEHLRKWCDRVPCIPSKPKPTLNDFRTELQKAGKLNALEVKQVDLLAAVGNACAHNLSTATQADVEKLLRDVRDFLTQHPLP